jgi:hypothetical protein
MHALLATNTTDDVLFIQEPWFGAIGTARCDISIKGKEVLGGAASPKWTLAYPHFSTTQRTKVMTYVRSHDRSSPFQKSYVKHIVRNDLCAHPCILITDMVMTDTYWCTINFYNDIDDPSALTTLLSLDLDPVIPTLLTGDFNLHSRSWSPPDWAHSHAADRVEEWLATQMFILLSVPGVPTHQGENGGCDSTLDLVWHNLASEAQATFQGAHVDWPGSLGSDHALIRTYAVPQTHLIRQCKDQTNRFDQDIDPEQWEEWHAILEIELPHPRSPVTSPTEIDTLVDAIYEAFNNACSATMKRKGMAPGFNTRWWNDECKTAAHALRDALTPEDKHRLNHELKWVTRRAKTEWANEYITAANVWEVAAWRHGRCSSHIAALRGADSELTFDHEVMADTLSWWFFAEDRDTVLESFPDDPPPCEARPFPPFHEDELFALLKAAANKSAPGGSGIGWDLMKKGWSHMSELLTNIYNACIVTGHHPTRWKEATVVVIPKADKPDYSAAKAYQPISLLENLSKLLEKAVAKRLQHDIVTHELIPTTQFGGRTHSSCLDAGLTLIHDVQTAHANGLKVGILLFNVRGFFDNVNHARLVALIKNMGFSSTLSQWTASFLANRKVRLRFNNITSDQREQPVGVPQGSPLSPVLSIAYTSPLLAKMGRWNNSSLGMYIDDGILFACAEDWSDVERLLWARYTVCDEWLRRAGLAIEPDKTELLFFEKPYERNPMPPPSCLLLPDWDANTYYVVRPVETLRYLGFFIHRCLKWEPHVRIMCNRAWASIKALQVLGNSIRGLSMANWRIVLNAICLPVMTWGVQLWYRTRGAKGLIAMLQRVQNDMVKVVVGAFHTAPREALLQLTWMLPMRHFVEKLTYTSALRLYRLPWASQLLQRLGPDWYVPSHGDFHSVVTCSSSVCGQRNQCPTALEALALQVPSDGPRVDHTAVSPWEVPNWVARTWYMGVVAPYVRKAWTRDLTASCEGMSIMITHTAAAVVTRHCGDLTVVGGAAATFSVGGSRPKVSAWLAGGNLTQFDADTYALARTAEEITHTYTDEVPPPDNIFIFSNLASALQAVQNPRSIKAHSSALRFHRALTIFTLCHSHVAFYLVWSPADGDLEGFRMASTWAAAACLHDPPNGLDRVQSAAFQKDRARARAFHNWEVDFHRERCISDFRAAVTGTPTNGHAHTHVILDGPSTHHHPLWLAAVDIEKDSRGKKTKRPLYSHHTTSTTLQLAVDHAFMGSYAQ